MRALRALTISAPLSLRSIRGFVYALAALQAIQASAIPVRGFIKSYWVVDYDHGFVRRGLAGAVLQTVAGRPTDRSVVVATWVVAGLAVVAVLVVAELLLRRATARSCALAILLASSPFTLDYAIFQRRPDQLAVPVLVLLGAALVRGRRWILPGCAAAGLLFAGLMFLHDGILLEDLPSALLMVVVLTLPDRSQAPPRVTAPALLLVAAPAFVAGAVVAIFGTASAATVAALHADASNIPMGRGTALDYLDDSVGTSIRLVGGFSHGAKIASLMLGLGLLAVHGWWLAAWVGQHPVRVVAEIARRRSGLVLPVSVGLATIALFVIGIDWLRWFAAVGCALLIVVSFHLLAGEREPTEGSNRVELPVLLLPAAFYLAALTPLPDVVLPGEIFKALLPW